MSGQIVWCDFPSGLRQQIDESGALPRMLERTRPPVHENDGWFRHIVHFVHARQQ